MAALDPITRHEFEQMEKGLMTLLEEIDKRHIQLSEAKDRALAAALASAEKAVATAETNAEKWRVNANEWRGAMNDREANLVQIKVYEPAINGIHEDLAELRSKCDLLTGTTAGAKTTNDSNLAIWAIGISVGSVIISVAINVLEILMK